MKTLCSGLLVAVGLLNVYPLIGVISEEQLVKLYGTAFDSPDLVTLMRHRAVLFGLLGGFLLMAAFRPSLQLLAAVAGLISMLSFVLLAYASGDIGPEVHRVVVADIVGAVATAIVLLIIIKERRNAN